MPQGPVNKLTSTSNSISFGSTGKFARLKVSTTLKIQILSRWETRVLSKIGQTSSYAPKRHASQLYFQKECTYISVESDKSNKKNNNSRLEVKGWTCGTNFNQIKLEKKHELTGHQHEITVNFRSKTIFSLSKSSAGSNLGSKKSHRRKARWIRSQCYGTDPSVLRALLQFEIPAVQVR